MKTTIKSFILLLSVFAIQGCSDLLETVPNDRISTAIFWKTDKDATLGANAVYTIMAENANHFFSWDGMTDIGYTNNPPQSAESFILQGRFDALNSRVLNDYKQLYAGVRSANTFLQNVGNVQTTNSALITRLTGEVRVMRAYFYTRLAFLWGDVPLVTKEITLDESKTMTRTPVSQVWDFIASELTDASANQLPTTQTEKGRITKGAALGLKARAMLYAGRYQDAADAANAVIALAPSIYALSPSYKNLFTTAQENSKEILLDIQFIKGSGISIYSPTGAATSYTNDVFQNLAPRSQVGNSNYVPTKKLVDAYQMTNGLAIGDVGSGFVATTPYANRDPRLSFSVFVPGDVLPNGAIFNPIPTSGTQDAVGATFTVSATGFNVKKYVNSEDLTTPASSGINMILMRYAEVLLTYAEAKVELGQLDASVYTAINSIRQRADVNMPAIAAGKTQAELRDIVRQERKVELAFEGLRYFDIRRWRIADAVMPGKVQGMTYVGPGAVLTTVEVPAWTNSWDDKNYLWPIPQIEKEMNPALGQNVGW